MRSGALLRVIVSVLAFNLIASLAFFALHTVRQHSRTDNTVWAVTVGTEDTAHAHILDSNRTFWEETILLLVFISANLIVGVGLIVIQIRYH